MVPWILTEYQRFCILLDEDFLEAFFPSRNHICVNRSEVKSSAGPALFRLIFNDLRFNDVFEEWHKAIGILTFLVLVTGEFQDLHAELKSLG